MDRTLQLARERCGNRVSKRMVKKVVNRCDRCARVDPAVTFSWMGGSVAKTKVWQQLAIDITYFGQAPYLTVLDSASKFIICKGLRTESADEIRGHLRQIFCEFGPPLSVISDNGTAFRSRAVQDLFVDWSIKHELACAYRSQGNGAVERAHRTVKRGAKRGGRTVEEAAFWYNATKGLKDSSPYELVFAAIARKPWVGSVRVEGERTAADTDETDDRYQDAGLNPFMVGMKSI